MNMIEVVFSDSECGAFKVGLKKGANVICSYTNLELGKLSAKDFDKEREKLLGIYFSDCSKDEIDEIKKQEKERFSKIIEAAKNGSELRIWHSSSPYSKCGYYHLIYNLQGINCRVYAVEMPSEEGYKQESERCDQSWREVNVGCLKKYTSLTVELSKEERTAIADKWHKLIKENAELRINIEGELTSVPINYLDEEILSYAPKKEYKIVNHIANCLNKCPHGLDVSFFEERIKFLIKSGKLKVNKEKILNL